MHVHGLAPLVSVIMATYNGSQYIEQSISSVLSQTMRDFELIIVNDCSTDSTATILDAIVDPRVRVLHNAANMGVVQSRNRCLAAARGRYVAMLDHDDLSRPMRLERQVAYLEEHTGTVLVGTATHTLVDGVLAPTRHPPRLSPVMVRWLLHVANPLVCSSAMFRTSAVRQLDVFMREDYKYADDYDLYHRLLALGDIARLDDPLTIYRLHANNTFKVQEQVMIGNAVKALTPAYQAWYGNGAAGVANLVVRHLAAGHAVQDTSTFAVLRDVLARLDALCGAEHGMEAADRAILKSYADDLWQRMARATVSNDGRLGAEAGDLYSGRQSSAEDLARQAFSRLPLQRQVKRFVQRVRQRPAAAPVLVPSIQLLDATYEPVKVDATRPPTLYVVVDTEAEFDWTQPFGRDLTNVTAFDAIGCGQAIFDRYGLRPVYVVDYPIASQDRSVKRLRAMLEQDACYVGAHLHPWTTPPFEEQVSNHNSYPGNLPADLEEQKLAVLVATIRRRLGVSPMFYKAGRYGVGAATARSLVRQGIKVDLSVLAGADLRSTGGPDFRGLSSVPYRVDGGRLLSMPVTRSTIGFAPGLGRLSDAVQQVPGLRWLRMQPILSRLRIADTITLTPEGVTAAEQICLIKAMLQQGKRQFVMHYHSPSLSPGHTPYVRTPEDADRFVQRIEDVCRYFFEDLGGMPGYPPDLLAMAARGNGQPVSNLEYENVPENVPDIHTAA